MEHFKHPACNSALLPPSGEEGRVSALYIRRTHCEEHGHMVTSYWRPSPEELAMLNAGHSVELTVWGVTHPPLYVGVTE